MSKGCFERAFAEKVVASLRGPLDEEGIDYEVCGSYRRKLPTLGDLDIAIKGSLKDAIYALKKHGITELEVDEKRKAIQIMVDGMAVDIYAVPAESWGAMLLFMTGSALFNVLMRGEAKKQGYKLNRYGLWHSDVLIAGREEKQVFDALGLEWLEPEERSFTQKDRGKKILRRTSV